MSRCQYKTVSLPNGNKVKHKFIFCTNMSDFGNVIYLKQYETVFYFIIFRQWGGRNYWKNF